MRGGMELFLGKASQLLVFAVSRLQLCLKAFFRHIAIIISSADSIIKSAKASRLQSLDCHPPLAACV